MIPGHTFTEREAEEIRLAMFYYFECNHGTAGHNRLSLICKMALALGIHLDRDTQRVVLPDNIAIVDESGNRVEWEQ